MSEVRSISAAPEVQRMSEDQVASEAQKDLESLESLFNDHVAERRLPDSAFDLSPFSPEKRIDILLSVYSDIRNSIEHWEDRIYHASVWSSGILLSAVTFLYQQKLAGSGSQRLDGLRIALAVAVLVFGIITQGYLFFAVDAFKKNSRFLIKTEAALRLCRKGEYFNTYPLVGFSGEEWVKNHRQRFLRISNAVVLLVSFILIVWQSDLIKPQARAGALVGFLEPGYAVAAMADPSSPPPRKGPRWIVDQITAAFESSQGGEPAPAGPRLSRSEVDDLVSEALEEELERLGRNEKDPKDAKDPKD